MQHLLGISEVHITFFLERDHVELLSVDGRIVWSLSHKSYMWVVHLVCPADMKWGSIVGFCECRWNFGFTGRILDHLSVCQPLSGRILLCWVGLRSRSSFLISGLQAEQWTASVSANTARCGYQNSVMCTNSLGYEHQGWVCSAPAWFFGCPKYKSQPRDWLLCFKVVMVFSFPLRYREYNNLYGLI